ncbi:unnamed protein product [Phytomonas sp. EM1]|nr:unnamed protein product [Phytomonas sp. EM1]|eukprot:CCW59579.1 unnamed protein product [Phytomonas sp. isolate EM1]
MLVADSGNLYIETGHPAYPHVVDFLISCCEPVSRTHHIEQYRIDSSSISAANAEGTYTCDMIRNVLRYYRTDSTGEFPLDLQKLSDIEAWVLSSAFSGSSELDGEMENGDSGEAAGEDLRVSYWRKFPSCLGTAGERKPAEAEQSSTRDCVIENNCVNMARISSSAATSAKEYYPRVLSLKVGGPKSEKGTPAEGSNERKLPNIFYTTTPLVALALKQPEEWTPRPLPALIEDLLAEEENSSKMQIVLQPRLRRFRNAPTPAILADGAHTIPADAGKEEEKLFYFIVSTNRQHLEMVVGELKEFLEPITLHGTTRWVLSDVDRSVEETNMPEAGRPAALRRLLTSIPPYVDGFSKASGKNSRRNGSHPRSTRLVYKSQVKHGKLRELKERLFVRFGVRADCFYDYLQDTTLHVEDLTFTNQVRLRMYQVASLERFRRGNKAHQGVVVLPCGAGKTLTGIGAAVTMKKRTIVLCINNMSVFQWQREFLRWTNLREQDVTICTAKLKQKPGVVFITTYSMLIAKRGNATGLTAKESEMIIGMVENNTWGLLLLDEVHTALARHFQEVLNKIRYKCVLGLSATLLREDDRIANLRHLVGPKLYEANWLELTRAGFLAKMECAEVQCPMPASFFTEYVFATTVASNRLKGLDPKEMDSDLDEDNELEGGGRGLRKRRRHHANGNTLQALVRSVAISNPYKLWCTQALLEFHRNRSPPDKIIIFCDYLADVRYYAHHLHLPFMDRETSESERENLLQYFQHSDQVNAIILTRVGDVALDLPCASVIIQISGLGASRRQEAQRLGRILRPKPPSLDNTCAYFYTLVSQDTHEVRVSYERQSWLRDQGFAYRVLRCEAVLQEFDRVGGRRCCIGAPQWWYEVPTPVDSRADSAAGEPVAHAGHWWVPFSPEASRRIQYAFDRGRDGCALEGEKVLGKETVRPPAEQLGGHVVRFSENWQVQFSSVDAPISFGTVTIGEGCDEIPEAVRRITFGQLRQPHTCLGGPCEAFALAQLSDGARSPTREDRESYADESGAVEREDKGML